MNFPLEYDLFRFLYWLINTPGIGGILVILIVLTLVLVILMVFRWIMLGTHADEAEVYSYPTRTLIEHEEH